MPWLATSWSYNTAAGLDHPDRVSRGFDAAGKQLNQYVVQLGCFYGWYRVTGKFAADKNTTAEQQADNAYPYRWNITPKA